MPNHAGRGRYQCDQPVDSDTRILYQYLFIIKRHAAQPDHDAVDSKLTSWTLTRRGRWPVLADVHGPVCGLAPTKLIQTENRSAEQTLLRAAETDISCMVDHVIGSAI